MSYCQLWVIAGGMSTVEGSWGDRDEAGGMNEGNDRFWLTRRSVISWCVVRMSVGVLGLSQASCLCRTCLGDGVDDGEDG